MQEGVLRHQLNLEVLDMTTALGRSEGVDAMRPGLLTGPSVIAVLGRDVVVRLLEISRWHACWKARTQCRRGLLRRSQSRSTGTVHGRRPGVAVATAGRRR